MYKEHRTRWLGWDLGYFLLVALIIVMLAPLRVNTSFILPAAVAIWAAFIAGRPVTYTPQRPVDVLKLTLVMCGAFVLVAMGIAGLYEITGVVH